MSSNSLSNLQEIINNLPNNETIIKNVIKAYQRINSPLYTNISCSISGGGGDSDVMLDICHQCDVAKKIQYVWFDTGLEYRATKDHLTYLEDRYGIEIKRIKAVKSIPVSCKQYGQPFLSKVVSEYVYRLQQHNFLFEDDSFDTLFKRYPNCKSALRWWTNAFGQNSTRNIRRNKWLKEFMVANPPTFNISNKCCMYAKKDVIKKYNKENDIDLNIMGVRQAEGGARAIAYKSCFDDNIVKPDNYRPLFYFTDKDKIEYMNARNIVNSACYTEYGLDRTGCAGCPFGKNFEFELNVIEKFEPKLFNAANNIFKESYKYMRSYKRFCTTMDEEYGSYAKYLRCKE